MGQVVVMEAVHASLPTAGRLVPMDWLLGQAIDPPEHAVLLTCWRHTARPGTEPPQQVAWAQPGWRAHAATWINQPLLSQFERLAGFE